MALPWTTAEEIEARREAIARRNAIADAAIREHGPAAVMRAAQEGLAAAAQPAVAAEIRRGLIGVVREAAAIGVGSPCEVDP